MSVVRKIPYIESTLARLTDTQLGLLAAALNSNDAPERYSLIDADSFIPALTGGDIIAPVKLVLEKGKPAYNGFLVHVTDKDSEALTLFIGYHRFQDLMLVEIDNESKNFERINEYCDINELRRVLNDLGGSGTGGLTPTGLLGLLEVGEGVAADISDDGTKVEVTLDQDIKDAISGNNEVVITITDEDYDESLEEYHKHIELNNTYFKVDFQGTINKDIVLFNPFFKAVIFNENNMVSFSGIGNEPEDRDLAIQYTASDLWFSVFNGLVSLPNTEY